MDMKGPLVSSQSYGAYLACASLSTLISCFRPHDISHTLSHLGSWPLSSLCMLCPHRTYSSTRLPRASGSACRSALGTRRVPLAVLLFLLHPHGLCVLVCFMWRKEHLPDLASLHHLCWSPSPAWSLAQNRYSKKKKKSEPIYRRGVGI